MTTSQTPLPNDLTLCSNCHCMTHTTTEAKCGKCGGDKDIDVPISLPNDELKHIEMDIIRPALSFSSYIVPSEGIALTNAIKAYGDTRYKEGAKSGRIQFRVYLERLKQAKKDKLL